MRTSVSSQPHQRWKKRPFGLLTSLVAATSYCGVLSLWSKFVILLYVKRPFAFIFSMNCQPYFLAWGSLVFTFKSKPQDEVVEGCSDEFSEEPVFTFLFHAEPGVRLEWPHLRDAVWPIPPVASPLRAPSLWGSHSLLLEPLVCFLFSSHVVCRKLAFATPKMHTFMSITAYFGEITQFFILSLSFFPLYQLLIYGF